MNKKYIIVGTIFLTAVALIGTMYEFSEKSSASVVVGTGDSLPPAKDIIDYIYNNDSVQFAYLAEPLPEKLSPDEDVTERTENSYARVIKKTKDETTYERRIYPQVQFAQDVNGQWRTVEYATSTKEAFDQNLDNGGIAARLARIFINTAHAATATIYSGAGDGTVSYSNSSYATARTAATGSNADSTGTTMTVEILQFGNYNIYRGFVPFDTSSISASASISSASLNLYVNANNIAAGGCNFITVVQTSQATHTTLTTADYNQCGAVTDPAEGIDPGDRKMSGDMTNGTYTSFPLNATGRGWVTKEGQSSTCSATNGVTCLGLRVGCEALNQAPGVVITTFQTSETSGTSKDPYLSVTYTIGSFAPWMFSDF